MEKRLYFESKEKRQLRWKLEKQGKEIDNLKRMVSRLESNLKVMNRTLERNSQNIRNLTSDQISMKAKLTKG